MRPNYAYTSSFKIEEYEKDEEKLRFQVGKDYPFEYFFDKATKERLAQNEEREYDESSDEESSEDEVEEAGEVKKEGSKDKYLNSAETNTKPEDNQGDP